MKTERNIEILSAGFSAAHEQMEQRPARSNYPQSLDILYDWLEDKIFALYEAVNRKKFKRIWSTVGEIIITTSQIAELTDNYRRIEKTHENEMVDN
jgi:hypothetical protein